MSLPSPGDSAVALITTAELEAGWPLTGVLVEGVTSGYRDRAVHKVRADQGTAANVARGP